MQTYSHFLLTALLRKKLHDKEIVDTPKSLLIGSYLPDVPLGIITIGYIIDRSWIRPHLGDCTRCSPTYDDLFFNNKWWITPHHLFHAPLLLFLYLSIGYWGIKRGKSWGKWLFWLAVGSGFHTTLDIFTHVNDGPLLLFPFDLKTRYHSLVSYWDKNHWGRVFSTFEHLLDLWLIIYLLKTRKKKNPLTPALK